MKKKFLSIILCLCIVIGVVSVTLVSAQEPISPDVAILENILNGDRYFVIDTLIGTNGRPDLSTNPHALANYVASGGTMMYNALDAYQDKDNPNYSAAYKAAVDIMEKVYNADDYTQGVADFVTEFAADLASIFSTNAENVISDLTYSTSELKYESILKEVLASDYTSSDGRKLSTAEVDLEYLEQLDRFAGELKTFSNYFLSYTKANYDGEDYSSRMEYYTNYLVPYGESVNAALNAFSKTQSNPAGQNEAEFLTLLATLAQYERFDTSAGASADIPLIGPSYFITDEVYDLIKAGNSAISTTSKTISTYAFIQSVASQNTAMKNALKRMANSSDSKMNSIFSTFANEIGQAGNAKLIGYETLMRYLRNAGVVTDIEQEAGKKLSDKLTGILGYSKTGIEEFSTTSAFSKATNVVGIASWCADTVTSFGGTCKKTYELKYLDKMIAQAIRTYRTDLSAYQSSKTDANAKKVLEDLMLIQKMRLRGETIAYKMTQGQFDSAIGRLLATGSLNSDEYLLTYLDQQYQRMVDAFIGASVMPTTESVFAVRNGEMLTIRYDADMGGLYGHYTKSNGDWYNIGEIQKRVCGGLQVNSGGTFMLNVDAGTCLTSYISNSGTVYIANGLQTLELTNNSGGSIVFADMPHSIRDIYLTGGSMASPSGGTVQCDNLTLSGTVSSDMNITCTGKLSVGGTLTGGHIDAKGDIVGNSGTVDSLSVCGSGQTQSGTLTVKNLTYAHSGTLTQNGTVYVTEVLQETTHAKIAKGENTVLRSGSIVSDSYTNPLTLDGAQVSGVSFADSLYIRGSTELADVTTKKLLSQTGGTLTITGDVTAKGGVSFAGSVNQTKGDFQLYGDLYGSEKVSLHRLHPCGYLPQKISGAITVKELWNDCKTNVTLENTVTVTEKLKEGEKINGTKNIIMTGTAQFMDDVFHGDITLKDFSGAFPQNIVGTIYVTGEVYPQSTMRANAVNVNGGKLMIHDATVMLHDDCTVQNGSISIIDSDVPVCGALTLQRGSVTVENSDMVFKNFLTTSSGTSFTVDETSTLSLLGANIDGSLTCDGLCRIKGDFSGSETINIADLIFDGALYQTVSGKAIYAKRLTTNCGKMLTVDTKIYVSEAWESNGNVQNSANIIDTGTAANISDKTYETPLTVEGDLVIDGYTLTAKQGVTVSNGSIIVKNGGSLLTTAATVRDSGGLTLSEGSAEIRELTLEKGTVSEGEASALTVDTLTLSSGGITVAQNSAMMVKHLATVSGGSITVDEGGDLTFGNLAIISNMGQMTVDGEVHFKGSAFLNSLTLSGGGTVSLAGDLLGSSYTVEGLQTFLCNGKLPQTLSGGTLHFIDLQVENPARGGVIFSTAAQYSGTYTPGDSQVTGTVTYIEK